MYYCALFTHGSRQITPFLPQVSHYSPNYIAMNFIEYSSLCGNATQVKLKPSQKTECFCLPDQSKTNAVPPVCLLHILNW